MDETSKVGTGKNPIRSRYSKLSSFNYVCDVNPDCDIKSLRTKNFGSEHDPDPESPLKLRFRRKSTIRGAPSTPTSPISPRRLQSRLNSHVVHQGEIKS